MMNRMVRASRADVHVYEEVERDIGATGQAATVVLIAAVATGIGQLANGGIGGLIGGVVAGLVGWVLWSFIAYWVGKTVFKTPNTRVSPGEMLRTLGFSQSPGVLNVLGIIPLLGPLVLFITSIWTLVLGIIAIRQAMDFSTGRAIATALVGFLPYIIIVGIVTAIVT
jgi:hypothetical protein